MSAPTGLVSLLNAPAFVSSHWGRSHIVWRGAADPASLLGSAEIERYLDASLLKWPYFSVLRHGEVPPLSAYTCTRDVIGQKRSGFPDAAKIRRLMADGASLKLNQLSDWNRPIREIRGAIEATLPVAVATYMFWTPPEGRGMLPHRDAAHVLAVQLEGYKEWRLYEGPKRSPSAAGLDVDASSPSHSFVLGPGDVLYLPHGCPHDALARDGTSLHLTFTLAEPTPDDLVDALLKHFTEESVDLVHRYHARFPEARSEEVRDTLAVCARGLDPETWLATALKTMREVVG